jgi:hypothetical protein
MPWIWERGKQGIPEIIRHGEFYIAESFYKSGQHQEYARTRLSDGYETEEKEANSHRRQEIGIKGVYTGRTYGYFVQYGWVGSLYEGETYRLWLDRQF